MGKSPFKIISALFILLLGLKSGSADAATVNPGDSCLNVIQDHAFPQNPNYGELGRAVNSRLRRLSELRDEQIYLRWNYYYRRGVVNGQLQWLREGVTRMRFWGHFLFDPVGGFDSTTMIGSLADLATHSDFYEHLYSRYQNFDPELVRVAHESENRLDTYRSEVASIIALPEGRGQTSIGTVRVYDGSLGRLLEGSAALNDLRLPADLSADETRELNRKFNANFNLHHYRSQAELARLHLEDQKKKTGRDYTEGDLEAEIKSRLNRLTSNFFTKGELPPWLLPEGRQAINNYIQAQMRLFAAATDVSARRPVMARLLDNLHDNISLPFEVFLHARGFTAPKFRQRRLEILAAHPEAKIFEIGKLTADGEGDTKKEQMELMLTAFEEVFRGYYLKLFPDAYFVAHVVTPIHLRLFKSRYGMELVETIETADGAQEHVLIVPGSKFREILEKRSQTVQSSLPNDP